MNLLEYKFAIAKLNALGLDLILTTDEIQDSFLENIMLKNGIIYFTENTHIGDLLHEAGHVAVTPSFLRKYMNGNLTGYLDKLNYPEIEEWIDNLIPDSQQWNAYYNCDETAAIAWSYCICFYLGIDSRLPFETGFNGKGEDIWFRFSCSHDHPIGFHFGIGALRANEMLKRKQDFPKLQRWIQI